MQIQFFSVMIYLVQTALSSRYTVFNKGCGLVEISICSAPLVHIYFGGCSTSHQLFHMEEYKEGNIKL